MYGFVNAALQQLVERDHGPVAWVQVRDASGVTDQVFLPFKSYPESATAAMVAAAAAVYGESTDRTLERLGRSWVAYAEQHGYAGLLASAGTNFRTCLASLDGIHRTLKSQFPALRPPALHVVIDAPDRLTLHYRSERDGLAPFLVGLLHGLAERWSITITVTQTGWKQRGCDHDIFAITHPPIA